MLRQTIDPPVSLGRLMVPAWASGLAPCVIESRVVALAEGAGVLLDYARGDDAGMVAAVVPGAMGLSAGALRAGVAEVFGLVLGMLRENGHPHPVRMWSFVPGIHERVAEGLDRYRVFNMGRYDAFSTWFDGPAAFEKVLPAATAVGHCGDQLVVCALGSRTPGVPVRNPRQTPSFEYSRSHGPLPPCFARAMVVRLAVGTRLLVSGTASICGEESVHGGLLEKQLDETFENLQRLLRGVRGADLFELEGIETARVYHPRASDRPWLVSAVSARLPADAAVEYVPASICRAELLVEIEATLAPRATVSDPAHA